MKDKRIGDISALDYIDISEDGKFLSYPDSSAIICLNDDMEILLIEQYRPLLKTKTLEIPGGVVDEGETPLMAVTREFVEETGYTVADVEFLFTLDLDVAVTNHKTHVFTGRLGCLKSLPEDGVVVKLMPLEYACEMIFNNQITHAPSVASILWLKGRNK